MHSKEKPPKLVKGLSSEGEPIAGQAVREGSASLSNHVYDVNRDVSSSTSESDSGTVRLRFRRRRPSRAEPSKETVILPPPSLNYEYEWTQPGFFGKKKDDASQLDTFREQEGTTKARSKASQLEFREQEAPLIDNEDLMPKINEFFATTSKDDEILQPGWTETAGAKQAYGFMYGFEQFELKLKQYVFIEISGGIHHMVELGPADVVKSVRAHRQACKANADPFIDEQEKGRSLVGDLTYRDVRQVFSEGSRLPSIEVRRDCIIVCLPPLTALILHDRVGILVTADLILDGLIVKLEKLSSVYSEYENQAGMWYEMRKSAEKRAMAEQRQLLASRMSRAYSIAVKSGGGRRTDEEDMRGSAQMGRTPVPGLLNDNSNGGGPSSSAKLFRFDSGYSAWQGKEHVPKFVSFPFEFSCLEVLISTAFELLNADLQRLESQLERVVKRVEKKSPASSDLEELHGLKTPIQTYAERVNLFDKAVDALIGNAADLRRMELTEHYFCPELYLKDVSDLFRDGDVPTINPNLEILLEFFDQELDQFSRRVRTLTQAIDNTERLVSLRLSLTRNRLISFDLFVTVFAVGLTAGSCISGVFGMNLRSNIEDSLPAFTATWIAIACTASLSLAAALYLVYRIRL